MDDADDTTTTHEQPAAAAHPHATLVQAFGAELGAAGQDLDKLNSLGATLRELFDEVAGAVNAATPKEAAEQQG
jgi:hypothetical protein